jgi:phage baseplate assembly protein V
MSFDRITGIVRRVFRRAVDPSTPSQQVQLESFADEPHRDVEVIEDYGLTAVPPPDVVEGLALFIAGESDHGVVIGWFDKTHRPTDLQPGEVKLYAAFGQSVFFDKLGQVVITSATGSKTSMLANGDIVHAPSSQKMKVIGDLEVTKGITAVEGIDSQGEIHSDVDVTAGAISVLNHHHGNVINGGNITDPPS